MEDEQLVEQMLALVEQLLQIAGPEWTMEFLQGGIEAAQEGGGEQPMEPEMMSQGGPQAMRPMAPPRPRNALSGQ